VEAVKLSEKIFPCPAVFHIHVCAALYRCTGLIQNIQLIRMKFEYSLAVEICNLVGDFYSVNV